jgi:pyruvate/2-oxoglutarate/acetoin dehydrogenase E1 component
VYNSIINEQHPVIVIENKTDYGKKILHYQAANFLYEINGDEYPVVKVKPVLALPTLTIVVYGGMADLVNSLLHDIFIHTDYLPELIVPSIISDLPIDIILHSVATTGRLLVIEEGSSFSGIGAEILAQVIERTVHKIIAKRIAAFPVPIPSVKSLEYIVLPDATRILAEINNCFN